jgi:hypothetical protein
VALGTEENISTEFHQIIQNIHYVKNAIWYLKGRRAGIWDLHTLPMRKKLETRTSYMRL